MVVALKHRAPGRVVEGRGGGCISLRAPNPRTFLINAFATTLISERANNGPHFVFRADPNPQPPSKTETTTKMDPKFNGTLQNVTATVGRRATLSCTIENLGAHKVSENSGDPRVLWILARVAYDNVYCFKRSGKIVRFEKRFRANS